VLVALDHPKFRHVVDDIFTRRVVVDCMNHACTVVHGDSPHGSRPDACCQYGADVDLYERDKILARAGELRAILRAEVRDVPWFETEIEPDADQPSGGLVRTAVHGPDGEHGCVFLAHDRRGCAIHRAALTNGWDFRGTKPHVCRLFPLTYTADSIMISDDYEDYSCAHRDDVPTLYRGARDLLAELFGAELVRALDALEAKTLARRLPVAR
jgi:Fe-S-cluster containining protein